MTLDWVWWRAWVPVDAVDAAALHGLALCLAGVALGDMDVHFAWQAWHLATWKVWHLWHWTGSGGALGSQSTPWTPRLFACQAWHLVTLTFTLRGRCGTC